MLSLQPLFEIFCQTDDFFVQSDVFHSQLFQLVKQGKCLLLGQLPAMYGLYNLKENFHTLLQDVFFSREQIKSIL